MSLICADGFDLYSNTTDVILAGWQHETGNNIQTTMGKFNGGNLTGDSDDNGWIKTLPVNALTIGDTIIVQWYYKIENTSIFEDEILAILGLDYNFQCGLKHNSDGSITALDNSGSPVGSSSAGVISGDMWKYIEFKALLNSGAGTITVRVDEVQVLNLSSIDTYSSDVDSVRFRGDDSSWRIDDVIIMDGNGARLKDFIGETRISTLLPSGDTSQDDWTQSSSGSTFELINDPLGNSPGAEYIQSSTSDQETRVTLENAPGNMATVYAINSVYQTKKTDVTDTRIKGLVNSNAVEELGEEGMIIDEYVTNRVIHELDQGSGSPTLEWTKTTIEALEVGVKIV